MTKKDFIKTLHEIENECKFEQDLRENGLSREDFENLKAEIKEAKRHDERREFYANEHCEYFVQMLEKQDFEAFAIKENFGIEDNTKFWQMQENAPLMSALRDFYFTRFGYL